MKLSEKLSRISCCAPAIRWVGNMGVSMAWHTCHRGDWMEFIIWLFAMNDVMDRDMYSRLRGVWAHREWILREEDMVPELEISAKQAQFYRERFSVYQVEYYLNKLIKLQQAGGLKI